MVKSSKDDSSISLQTHAILNDMKIALAQNSPVVGDISLNLENHLELIEVAASLGAELIVFPELSLTGYEPKQASELSLQINDPILDHLQEAAKRLHITVGVGFPIKTPGLPTISTAFFRPSSSPWIYSKRYLHQDEQPYFSPATESNPAIDGLPDVSFAICYELNVEEHCQMAEKNRSNVYLASVAKTESGVRSATKRLSQLAKKNGWITMMVNSIGRQDGVYCSGTTSAWNRDGELIGNLDSEQSGLLIIDRQPLQTECVSKQTFS